MPSTKKKSTKEIEKKSHALDYKNGNGETKTFLGFPIVPEYLFFTSMIIVAAAVLGASFFLSVANYRSIIQRETDARFAILDRSAIEVENFFDGRILLLQSFADQLGKDLKNQEGTKEAIELLVQKNPEFVEVHVHDEGGEIIELQSHLSELGLENLGSRDRMSGFLKAQKGILVIGETQVAPDGTPFIHLAFPIFSEPAMIEGVLVVDLNLEGMWDLVDSIPVGEKGVIYVVDNLGNLIAHPDRKFAMQMVNLNERNVVFQNRALSRQGLTEGRLQGDYQNQEGIDVYAVAKPLDYGWGVVAEEPEEDFFRAASDALRFNITIVGIILFFFLLLFISSRIFTRVFHKLEEDRTILANVNQRLVEKERDLVAANKTLEERNAESNETAHVLVRRDLELTRANEVLQELDAIKSDFVSVVAHQLRTPLSAIKWALHLVLSEDSGPLNKDQKKLVGNSYQSTERMINLVGDLLDVARLEEGLLGFRFTKQSYTPILEGAIKRAEAAAKRRGVIFSSKVPKTLPEISFDAERITVVLDNLLQNAIRYTESGKKVEMKVSKKKDGIEVEIKDEGIGIPESQSRHVFERFFRARNAQLYQTEGTGLGLFTAKNIVDNHKGSIRFESVEGKGSSFFFSLPIPKSNKT